MVSSKLKHGKEKNETRNPRDRTATACMLWAVWTKSVEKMLGTILLFIRKVKREKRTEFGCRFSLAGDQPALTPPSMTVSPQLFHPQPRLNRCGPRPATSACLVSWRCPEPNFRPEILEKIPAKPWETQTLQSSTCDSEISSIIQKIHSTNQQSVKPCTITINL